MKMKASDFEALGAALDNIMASRFAAAYRNAGLSHRRYRWDCLHASKYATTPLYDYLNDDHIDTALRAILGADWSES